MEYEVFADYTPEIFTAVENAGAERIAATQTIVDKTERQNAESDLKEELKGELISNFEESKISRKEAIKKFGKYAAMTAIGTFIILNPKKSAASSPPGDPWDW